MMREAQFVGIGFITAVLHAFFLSICVVGKDDKYHQKICSPSSCGDIRNISYPFRLQGDPSSCGFPEYEFTCENNHTMVNLYPGKYYVAEINYHNYTIRVVDPELAKKHNYCQISSSLLSVAEYYKEYGFPYYMTDEFTTTYSSWPVLPSIIPKTVLMECDQAVSDDKYIPIIPCSISVRTTTYTYVVNANRISAGEIRYSCTVVTYMVIQQLKLYPKPRKVLSMADLHDYLLMGLHLSFLPHFCNRHCRMKGQICSAVEWNVLQCYKTGNYHLPDTSEKNWLWTLIITSSQVFMKGLLSSLTLKFQGFQLDLSDCQLYYPCNFSMIGGWIVGIIVPGRAVVGLLCLFVYLIYKFHRRHLSLDDSVEEFLRSHKNLQPIKYSYSDIKKMTHNFANKLGQGGYGSVYKGKLRSGRTVAVKVLLMSKANGQDFINEVATIGRIHHVNVVRLVGFCVQGSKWALIYDFMPNGSLDKFVFLKEENNNSLSWEMMYKVALGVGRGIEYLHQGCDMQILHFDIKPHNILLDEDFTPKVSDFGLAKLYSTDESMVFLTAARGTLGYIAPEIVL